MSIQIQIDKLNAALDALDVNKYGDDDSPEPETLFREIFLTHIYELDGDREVGTNDCESVRLAGATAFYRLLFLPNQSSWTSLICIKAGAYLRSCLQTESLLPMLSSGNTSRQFAFRP